MEIKDIDNVQKSLKVEIDEMGRNVNRDELAKERFFPILKQEFDLIFLKSTQNLYYIIQDHPLTWAYCSTKGELKDAETLSDFQNNLRKMQSGSEIVAANIKRYKKAGLDDVDFDAYADSRRQYSAFLKCVNNYVSSAIYLSDYAKSKSSSAYLKQLTKTLPLMEKSLAEASKYLDSWKKYGSDHSELFKRTIDFFSETATEAISAIQKVQEEERKLQEAIEASKPKVEPRPVKKVEFAPNPAEIERVGLINEANMMYDELVRNTMRDLEKQVPYSVREMYDYFVNVKFAKFVKNFSMPLSSSTKASVAKEVCAQINELNNYISKISENAVTTNVYMMKE